MTASDDYYSEALHGAHDYFDLGDFPLEFGGTLPGAKLGYKTHGELNEARDNAILFPIMYSGTSRDMEGFIGEGRPLDPTKYFIVLPGQFGGGFSSSPSNTPSPLGGAAFPSVTVGDDVRAQHTLLTEGLGVTRLQLVLGWSMGAQQTYEWAVRYPDFVLRACPFAGTAAVTPHNELFVRLHEDAIRSDPAWNGGWYEASGNVQIGLRRHARIFAMMGLTQKFYRERDWEQLGFSSLEDFLRRFWEAWFLPMDPNNLLTEAAKWRNGDVSVHADGDLAKALGRITAKTVVTAFGGDMFFPPADLEAEQTLIPDSELRVIDSPLGHFAMFALRDADREAIDTVLRELLAVEAVVPERASA